MLVVVVVGVVLMVEVAMGGCCWLLCCYGLLYGFGVQHVARDVALNLVLPGDQPDASAHGDDFGEAVRPTSKGLRREAPLHTTGLR